MSKRDDKPDVGPRDLTQDEIASMRRETLANHEVFKRFFPNAKLAGEAKRDSLLRKAREIEAYGKKAFAHLKPKTKEVVDRAGIEPAASAVQKRRSPD